MKKWNNNNIESQTNRVNMNGNINGVNDNNCYRTSKRKANSHPQKDNPNSPIDPFYIIDTADQQQLKLDRLTKESYNNITNVGKTKEGHYLIIKYRV